MTGPRWTALVLTTLLCWTPLPGEEPHQAAPTPAPFPRHYRKLGLDKDQAEKVRKTQADFQSRIDKLKQQLQALEKGENAELEKILTAAQRARLKELQAQGPGKFKISPPGGTVKVLRGTSTRFGVLLTHDKGFEGDVRLTYPDLPKGVKIQPNPFVFKEGGDPVAHPTISTDKSLPAGEYRIKIQATPEDGEPVEVTFQILVPR